jgi:hypothetical protein
MICTFFFRHTYGLVIRCNLCLWLFGCRFHKEFPFGESVDDRSQRVALASAARLRCEDYFS